MKKTISRRNFLGTSAIASAGLTFASPSFSANANSKAGEGTQVGIIGLDTSHCIAFTKALNNPNAGPEFGGYKVVAAFPTAGSPDVPSSIDRLAGFTEQVKQQGVEIVNSIDELLKKVDVVLLETVDGRKHLEQALPVIKAGKPLFIDKPIAASLKDAIKIYDAAKKNNVPIFSSSSLRFMGTAQEVVQGENGESSGSRYFQPCDFGKIQSGILLVWHSRSGNSVHRYGQRLQKRGFCGN